LASQFQIHATLVDCKGSAPAPESGLAISNSENPDALAESTLSST